MTSISFWFGMPRMRSEAESFRADTRHLHFTGFIVSTLVASGVASAILTLLAMN